MTDYVIRRDLGGFPDYLKIRRDRQDWFAWTPVLRNATGFSNRSDAEDFIFAFGIGGADVWERQT